MIRIIPKGEVRRASLLSKVAALKAQLLEMKNMMKNSFDLQMDIQRSIRQEVAAGIAAATILAADVPTSPATPR